MHRSNVKSMEKTLGFPRIFSNSALLELLLEASWRRCWARLFPRSDFWCHVGVIERQNCDRDRRAEATASHARILEDLEGPKWEGTLRVGFLQRKWPRGGRAEIL